MQQLLREMEAPSLGALWHQLAERPYAAVTAPVNRDLHEAVCPKDAARISIAAERALAHRVDLLGSGEISLGARIDWHRDYKSGHRWKPAYCRDIDYADAGRPSDVKFPWEVSRMQWLIPAGQMYLLSGEERYAEAVRRILEDWIEANPFAGSVNWAIAMEAAMRVIVWTWFFHVFHGSRAWADEAFQAKFLCSLYLHAEFTERHFEFSDINANHTLADAAGLVFAGLFFGGSGRARRWQQKGWQVLSDELAKQVTADGVDFEGSVPYHRLVTELFLLPALYRLRLGLTVPEIYSTRICAMARFTEAYTRPDGSLPVWGDADDGRALPFGGQPINDHRYLLGLVGVVFGDDELVGAFSGDKAELAWLLGDTTAASVSTQQPQLRRSKIFREGGYAILRNEQDHVFIDCGGVGMGGRGGHGHNDILSCDVFLAGAHIISDCGAYVYTADYAARNRFRSTAFHNTPFVDGEEINRFVRPEELFWLRDDAKPEIRLVEFNRDRDLLRIAHTGYLRLSSPVVPVRTFILDHESHSLTIEDMFEGAGDHRVEIPLHLAIGVRVAPNLLDHKLLLQAGTSLFAVDVLSPGWQLSIEPAEISPSYGLKASATKLVWRTQGSLKALKVRISPVK